MTAFGRVKPVYVVGSMKHLSGAWVALFASLMWLVLLYDLTMIEFASAEPREIPAKTQMLAAPGR